jgi:abhydrolase domain-containing protein 11
MYPATVKSLYVEDIAPVDYTLHETMTQWVTTGSILQAMAAMGADGVLSAAKSRTEVKQSFERMLPGIEEGVKSFVLQNMVSRVESDGGGFAWRCNVDVLADSVSQMGKFPFSVGDGENGDIEVAPFDGPTIFAGGGNSNYINQHRDQAKCRQLFPNCTFETIDDAGHWVHAEKPAEFVSSVSRFLWEASRRKWCMYCACLAYAYCARLGVCVVCIRVY